MPELNERLAAIDAAALEAACAEIQANAKDHPAKARAFLRSQLFQPSSFWVQWGRPIQRR